MKFIISLTITLFLISACTPHSDKKADKMTAFKALLKKFKPIKLPYYYDENIVNKSIPAQVDLVDLNSTDTLFIKPDIENGASKISCYGLLPDTNKYYALIGMFTSDGDYPLLFTFSKEGILLSKERLIVNGYGDDASIVYCNSIGTIYKDLSIYCADSCETKKIDSSGQPIDGTETSSVQFKKGQITKTGKVTMSKKQTIDLPKNIK